MNLYLRSQFATKISAEYFRIFSFIELKKYFCIFFKSQLNILSFWFFNNVQKKYKHKKIIY